MPFAAWQFRYPFRKYQRIILNEIEAVQHSPHDDRRYHIVAPPGSGKTIVGLELIRRFGRPALVLAPTTTIQMQWRERVRMFLPPHANVDQWVSTDPARAAPLWVLTYQRVAVQDPDRPFAQEAARRDWLEDLIARGQAQDPDDADAYLTRLAEGNPDAYRRELRRRYPRLKRRLLRADPDEVARFLHPNAQKLIHEFAAQGVGTVVLDECHHLLDYWAVVLRYLLARLEAPRVVGLTATLPSPEDDFAYENYTALLGPVDFEIPTPAVVKEGNLAPYRNLVFFTEPTPPETNYLKKVDAHFTALVRRVLTSPAFLAWLEPRIRDAWQATADESPALALAGLRWLRALGRLPADTPRPPEADVPPTLEDRLVLLEHYALRALLPSDAPEDRDRFRALRERLRPFGLTLTSRGIRQSRTPGDLVLAFSESKADAVVEILQREMRALGDRLRAVVVTDFERRTGSLRRYRTRGPVAEPIPLQDEAGSARFVFRRLAEAPSLTSLHPVLVTGRSLWIDRAFRAAFESLAESFRAARALHFRLRFIDHGPFWEVRGEGRDWGSRTYVAMLTEAFEKGQTRCLVGTRGLFGEGWDALTLNTLIDLTTVTTSVGVQQLRGRSLRKDPAWPHKVSHNWDVICVAPGFRDGGDRDLQRFRRRHARMWGVVQYAGTLTYPRFGIYSSVGHALGKAWHERVVRGVAHVDPLLEGELATRAWHRVAYGGFTRLMLHLARDREATYEAWHVGDEYSNFSYRLAQIRARDLRIRTVFTLEETVEALWKRLKAIFASAGSAGLLAAWYVRVPADAGWKVAVLTAAISAGGMTLAALAWNARALARLFRKLFREQPVDAILLDMARALLVALREAGLVSRKLQPDYVRVVAQPDDTYTVELDYASPEDAARFTEAFRELFEPVMDARYLILRTDDRLPRLWSTALWRLLRVFARPAWGRAYHPVPRILAQRRERAEAFARAWSRYVGGGKLVYTRSPEGRRVLYAARTQKRPRVDSWAFEFWR